MRSKRKMIIIMIILIVLLGVYFSCKVYSNNLTLNNFQTNIEEFKTNIQKYLLVFDVALINKLQCIKNNNKVQPSIIRLEVVLYYG